MTIAVWNNRFETGIALIDTQHKALFEALNKLADSFQVGTAKAQVEESLGFLLKYTVEHFETEEAFMKDMDYPALASHKAEHARLIRKTRDLRDRLVEGKPMAIEVTVFFADWLTHHIHEVDMGYVAFMKEKTQA